MEANGQRTVKPMTRKVGIILKHSKRWMIAASKNDSELDLIKISDYSSQNLT